MGGRDEAVCAGRVVGSADVYARIGAPPYEADARLRAAEQLLAQGRGAEADAQLDQAVVFWQSVGATACVRDAEALLAASA